MFLKQTSGQMLTSHAGKLVAFFLFTYACGHLRIEQGGLLQI